MKRLLTIVLAVFLALFLAILPALAATAPVPLGSAQSFAVLAGSMVTNTGPSRVSGDVGVSPGTAVTGFPPGLVSNGSIHSADALAVQAQNSLITAYNDAAGRTPFTTVGVELAGPIPLVSGVYRGGALRITGTLTLDGQNDPNSVFIFQASSDLITADSSRVVLINGAQACNVFWQVTSSATLGTNSTFAGTILALTSITATTGATIEGRLLARNGQVSLDSNTINRPTCGTAPTTTTVPGATTTTTVPGASTTVPDPGLGTPGGPFDGLPVVVFAPDSGLGANQGAGGPLAIINSNNSSSSSSSSAAAGGGVAVAQPGPAPQPAPAPATPALARTGSDSLNLVTLALVLMIVASLLRRSPRPKRAAGDKQT